MENWKILILQLREVAKLKGKTINELAEQRKVNQSAISSFFSIKSPPSLATFDEMCNLIGVKLTLEGRNGEVIPLANLEAIAKMQLEFIENRNRKINEILDLNDKANDDVFKNKK